MAGEHSFPISPQVPKSSDLRGQVKFKLMTVSEDLVFPGNCKKKNPAGTNGVFNPFYSSRYKRRGPSEKSTGSEYSVFQIKFCTTIIQLGWIFLQQVKNSSSCGKVVRSTA